MSKKVLIALPTGLLETVDYIAQAEHRTRSDLIRKSLRRYIQSYRPTLNPNLPVVERKASDSLPPKQILTISDDWQETKELTL